MPNRLIIFLLAGSLLASNAHAGSAEQLATQATQALAAKNYAQAERYLEQLQSQHSPLPQSFGFLYGLSLFQQQKLEQAKPVLEAYLAQYGANGPYSEQVQAMLKQLGKADDRGIEMVKLPNGILMGKYEVTQGQWQKIMGNNPSYFSTCGNNCPVEQVGWDDVQQFIQRLNQQTGKRHRLPTEDEWYAACQAGSSHKYCGSDSIGTVAWYDENSGRSTHTVGQKQPNAWGLFDMSGNVSEWTSSCYDGDCSLRVLRGGSRDSGPSYQRSSYRDGYYANYRLHYLGFRLAQDP